MQSKNEPSKDLKELFIRIVSLSYQQNLEEKLLELGFKANAAKQYSVMDTVTEKKVLYEDGVRSYFELIDWKKREDKKKVAKAVAWSLSSMRGKKVFKLQDRIVEQLQSHGIDFKNGRLVAFEPPDDIDPLYIDPNSNLYLKIGL